MKLVNKGPIIAPPVLKGWAQEVSAEIQSWTGLVAATHWTIGDSTRVNGADFYVGENELGHIHLDGEVHLVLSVALREALVAKGLAQPFMWSNAWVQYRIKDEISAQHAAWLFQLGYDRLNGKSDRELKQIIDAA